MKSLQASQHPLASASYQVALLSKGNILAFQEKLKEVDLFPLKPTNMEILQVNLGKMCNQTCNHCHVDAGPDRKEIMTQETLQLCLDILATSPFTTVDLTGGAPEMNPHFRWFVAECRKIGKKILVRCNLTIILANAKYQDLPQFFAENQVEVISSLPCYTLENTDKQRGNGVFDKSIQALKMLNAVGYGKPDSGLVLNLVYNPGGASLPGNQAGLEADYKRVLWENFEIEFNSLFTITNMPISRFLDYLREAGKYETYMQLLLDKFNPAAAQSVMCRNTLSVSWDGKLYDCDFNQMLELGTEKVAHLRDFDYQSLQERNIVVNQHCYGCTAGSGSSCGGAIA